jgi:ABC-type transport system involved in multi-copper enzyme maturation permease subunit
MTSEENDETYVRKFGFRPFTGARLGRLYRIMSVAWFNLIESIRRSGFTKFLLVMMIFNLIIQDVVIIVLARFVPLELLGVTLDDLFRGAYADSVLGMVSISNRIATTNAGLASILGLSSVGTSFLWLLLLSVVGGGLIADDKLHRTTETYFSRITRLEYVLGKLLSLLLFSAFILTFPAMLQYVLLCMGLGVGFLNNLGLLLWAIGFTLLAATALSMIILSLSSLTKRRSLASLTLFIIVVLMSSLPSAFGLWYLSEPVLLLIDFVGCIALLGAMTLGLSTVTVNGTQVLFYNGLGLEGYMVVTVVALVFLFGIVIMFTTILRGDK